MESKNPIQVTDRLFLVMETLADLGPSTLADLCRHLDLNKSTIHRLLSSLIYVGYIRQDEESGKYSLSFKLLSLSGKVLNHIDILNTVRPFLKKLSADTGETVHFVQLDGNEAVYIHKEESYQNVIRMASRTGSRLPLYCSGVGKAILADMSDEEIEHIWNSSDIHSLTPLTIVEHDRFMQNIELVRQRGYAMDDEENEMGVRCIATSVRDFSGKTRYAFSISAPLSRMEYGRVQELSRILLDTKKNIEDALQ